MIPSLLGSITYENFAENNFLVLCCGCADHGNWFLGIVFVVVVLGGGGSGA